MKPLNKGYLRITDKTSCTNLSVIKRFHCSHKCNAKRRREETPEARQKRLVSLKASCNTMSLLQYYYVYTYKLCSK